MTARFFFSEPKATEDQQAELSAWDQVKDSTDPRIVVTYLNKYPLGSYAVVARTLIAALEKQREMENAAKQEGARRQAELRKTQDEVRKAQEAANLATQAKRATDARLAAVPPIGEGSTTIFDGVWTFTRSVTAICGPSESVFEVHIQNGIVTGPAGGKGSLSPNGSVQLPGKANTFSGMLNGNSGKGTYTGRCTGTFTAKRG